MTTATERPIPLLDDIPLTAIQSMEHMLDAGFIPTSVAGLDGQVQQRLHRPSHKIHITGILEGETKLDDLATLQEAAASGEEITFAADIVTALDLQKVVVTQFRAVEYAGQPGQMGFELQLAESPPLPPPAELSGFGGLDDFGLGDLGFDTDLMDDLAGLADDIAGAVEGAMDAIEGLQALAGLGDLGFSGDFKPLQDATDNVGTVGKKIGEAGKSLGDLFG
ncbi:MAG: hypothetical protein G3M70_05155 [Candidatus Nitronauta litoralis]|uniref:Uncharacterized protein n=1 Tax=Candidatus Nitronauta litoralis TaxID=2705533 RepID=A0A7T0FZ87_9BACT|nr:MAG: hypothetical protein G3M70_05155 [Candidatus Nitronauta litoralis]